jgi:16S rRNA (guanine966-N2)-methyltransferase
LIRITGGRLKGRMAGSAVKEDLRPTTSFFREWMFNVLTNITSIEDVTLLDMFAGTGIVSFEFLSRGAASSVLVDNDEKMVSLIKKNISSLSLINATAVRSDAVSYLKNTFSTNSQFPFNTVFIDAPYSKFELAENCAGIIFSNKVLLPDDFIMILESPKEKKIDPPEGFELIRQKSSGTTLFTIIRSSS